MDGIEDLIVSVTVVHSARGFSGLELGGFYLESFCSIHGFWGESFYTALWKMGAFL
jgi:hypothetical protein